MLWYLLLWCTYLRSHSQCFAHILLHYVSFGYIVWHLCSLSHTLPNHSLTVTPTPQLSLSTSICHGLFNASFVYLQVLPLRYVFLCCSTWIYFGLGSRYTHRSRFLTLNLYFFNASVALLIVIYWIILCMLNHCFSLLLYEWPYIVSYNSLSFVLIFYYCCISNTKLRPHLLYVFLNFSHV